MVNSPIRWVGGKSRLRDKIIEMIPHHSCYAEPFSGAAWVLFGKQKSDVEIINDRDEELVNFFRVVKNWPEEFCASFEWELISRSEFERLANLDTKTLNKVERAHRFYYLLMAGWGGEMKAPRLQTSITDGANGNRLSGAMRSIRERIKPVHERLSTVIIENLDWRDFFSRYDRKNVFMYVDPPYPDNKCGYKYNMRAWSDHQELYATLENSQCRWILSSYDIPEVRSMFSGYDIHPVRFSSGMKKCNNIVINQEILVSNFSAEKTQDMFDF